MKFLKLKKAFQKKILSKGCKPDYYEYGFFKMLNDTAKNKAKCGT